MSPTSRVLSALLTVSTALLAPGPGAASYYCPTAPLYSAIISSSGRDLGNCLHACCYTGTTVTGTSAAICVGCICDNTDAVWGGFCSDWYFAKNMTGLCRSLATSVRPRYKLDGADLGVIYLGFSCGATADDYHRAILSGGSPLPSPVPKPPLPSPPPPPVPSPPPPPTPDPVPPPPPPGPPPPPPPPYPVTITVAAVSSTLVVTFLALGATIFLVRRRGAARRANMNGGAAPAQPETEMGDRAQPPEQERSAHQK